MRMRHIVIGGLSDPTVFVHILSKKGTTFGGRGVIEHKIFSTTFV
jgi:hypothetical protein